MLTALIQNYTEADAAFRKACNLSLLGEPVDNTVNSGENR